jgi:beta-lactamase superfamily II metal-dependent hydrolase
MKAHFINVGQADSILLEFKSAAILIDAGGETTGDDRDRDHLVGYLNTFFQGRPDLNRTIYSIIISHPHLDHTKNLMAVMQNFTVRNFVDGGNQRGSGFPQLRSARRFARDHHIIYNVIEDAEIGEEGYQTSLLRALTTSPSNVDVRFLAGGRDDECEDANNESLVVRVKYGQKSFIFTGDSEFEDQQCFPQIDNLLDWYGDNGLLDVDVYKVGHHGSRNGTNEAFMRAMTPQVSVISAGSKDTQEPGPFHAFQFGHPRESAVSIIEGFTSDSRTPVTVYTMDAVRDVHEDRRMEKAVYCTCWDGDVVVSTNNAGTTLSTQTSGL